MALDQVAGDGAAAGTGDDQTEVAAAMPISMALVTP
jgi:hypothetical protein